MQLALRLPDRQGHGVAQLASGEYLQRNIVTIGSIRWYLQVDLIQGYEAGCQPGENQRGGLCADTDTGETRSRGEWTGGSGGTGLRRIGNRTQAGAVKNQDLSASGRIGTRDQGSIAAVRDYAGSAVGNREYRERSRRTW